MIRRVAAEGLGTALLLAIVVGSGIMGERLAAGNAAIALLANSIATGAGLFVLIAVFAPVSGAHFNPAVTLALAIERAFPARDVAAYLTAQVGGACLGTFLAHAMFGLPVLQVGLRERATAGEWLGEAIATFGLVLIIRLLSRASRQEIASAVALWITAAYWFTSSVYFLDKLRQSSGNDRAQSYRYVCGNRADERSRVHRGTACGSSTCSACRTTAGESGLTNLAARLTCTHLFTLEPRSLDIIQLN